MPLARQPVEMKQVSDGTNSVPPKAKWHTVAVTPRPGLPKIHTYQDAEKAMFWKTDPHFIGVFA